MDKLRFELVDYRPEYALELVKMWRRSFQRAMGLEEQDDSGEVSAQLDFLSAIDPATIHVAMDPESSTVVGFMVLSGEKLDHLYVHVDYQGLGLGTTLLNLAKQKSPAGIELFTFQRNQAAQDFYRSRGFREVQRGFAGFQDNPWATRREQLADIKFRSEPGAARA
ncbi:MAG: GNAT family N-acetyltransferase [Gammaproteobacteria bacterium]|nr:GNAT family N-acetyltransferase [Gammaproteobacteria bacterium]